jgi:hypothetical protein
LHKTGLLRVVLENVTDLPDGGVDAVIGVEEHTRAPDSLDDLATGDDLPTLLDQQQQKFRGNPLQLQPPARASQLISAGVQLEVVPESERFWNSERLGSHGSTPQMWTTFYIEFPIASDKYSVSSELSVHAN